MSTAAPQQQTVWRQLISRWGALSYRSKGLAIATVVVLQALLVGVGWHTRQGAAVDLYPTKLSPYEVPEISRALLDMGIEHEVTPANDGVLLQKELRSRARAGLASRNLPLHRVLTAAETDTNMARTSSERKALEQRLLEGEITMALRDVNGVQDARVKVSVPERAGYLSADNDPTRAAVTLALDPGTALNREAVNGLLHLVAFSVPGLTPENVQIVDTHGRNLSAQFPRDDDGGLQASGAQFQVRSAEEKRMQEKVQEALDAIFPGKTRVLVNLDLDFTTQERRLYTPGSEKDDGLVKDSFQLVTEMLDGKDKDKKTFRNHKESANYKFTENYMASLAKHARVERISASVFADGASPAEAEALKHSVGAALGVRVDRGDLVYVDTAPWDHQLLADASESASHFPLQIDEADRIPSPNTTLMLLMLAQTGLLVGLGAFVYASHRRAPALTLESAQQPNLFTTGIVDHSRNKMGQTSADHSRTGKQTSEMLEGIVRERPNQVADLLRSTWLSS